MHIKMEHIHDSSATWMPHSQYQKQKKSLCNSMTVTLWNHDIFPNFNVLLVFLCIIIIGIVWGIANSENFPQIVIQENSIRIELLANFHKLAPAWIGFAQLISRYCVILETIYYCHNKTWEKSWVISKDWWPNPELFVIHTLKHAKN